MVESPGVSILNILAKTPRRRNVPPPHTFLKNCGFHFKGAVSDSVLPLACHFSSCHSGVGTEQVLGYPSKPATWWSLLSLSELTCIPFWVPETLTPLSPLTYSSSSSCDWCHYLHFHAQVGVFQP
jgi:hypothetical protein